MVRGVELAHVDITCDILEGLCDGTVERARGLDPDLLHEAVDGEWSFIETLRHLVFATDAWVGGVTLGATATWDPVELPWDEMLVSDTEPVDAPGWPLQRKLRWSVRVYASS